MSSAQPVRLMILGTGGMAGTHANHFGGMEGVQVVAGVDVNTQQLDRFCHAHSIAHAFTDLNEALNWGDFDAVANVTPDHVHHKTTLACLAAGKHVFCEKPLAVNHADAQEMTDVAMKANLVAMVNLTYRNVPALQLARKMVLDGDIGEIRHVEASYLQSWLTANNWGDWRTDPKWLWRLSTSHGSNGVLGDIGIHILDFATYGAGLEIAEMDCKLKTFHKVEGDRIGEYKLDANDSFVMSVVFENGALGTIHASRFATGYANDLRLRLHGTVGALEIEFGGRDAFGDAIPSLKACLGENIHSQTWLNVPLDAVVTNYQRFIEAVRAGETREPSFAHATKLQHWLDLGMASE